MANIVNWDIAPSLITAEPFFAQIDGWTRVVKTIPLSVIAPGWANPDNMTLNDGVSSAQIALNGLGSPIQLSNWGFSIPTGATIQGIAGNWYGTVSNPTAATYSDYGLLVNGNTYLKSAGLGGPPIGQTGQWLANFAGTDGNLYPTFLGTSDAPNGNWMWDWMTGRFSVPPELLPFAITAEDINLSNFGFTVTPLTGGGAVNLALYSVALGVYYTGGSISSVPNNVTPLRITDVYRESIVSGYDLPPVPPITGIDVTQVYKETVIGTQQYGALTITSSTTPSTNYLPGIQFFDALGNPLSNGIAIIALTKDCLSPLGQIPARHKLGFLLDDDGVLRTNPALWPNSLLLPNDSTYVLTVYSAAGELSFGPTSLTVPEIV